MYVSYKLQQTPTFQHWNLGLPQAEAEAPPRPSLPKSPDSSRSSHDKKPIYDDLPPLPATVPTPPSQLTQYPLSSVPPSSDSDAPSRGPTPTDRLAGQIRIARLWLHGHACTAEDGVNSALTRAFALERSFTETVAGLAPARESGERLLPGGIYVLVAAMAGSVVTRNRGILLRSSVPLGLGILAARTFVPVTSQNVANLVWEWEKKVPAVAETHVKIVEGVEHGIGMARMHVDIGKNWVDEKIGATREGLESWVKKGK